MIIDGNNTSEIIFGTDENDTINANGGNDTVFAGGGNDYVKGGTGNDALAGGTGQDYFDGGIGTDTVSFYHYSGKVTADLMTDTASFSTLAYDETLYSIENLSGGTGNDSLFGDNNNNDLYGNQGNDSLYGRVGDDKLYGQAGNDYLYGQQGNDKLDGGTGDDYLSGGSGDDELYGASGEDTLRGGSGADDFIFKYKNHGLDTIKDFKWTEGDKIVIDKSTFGATSNSQFLYNSSTGTLSFNPGNGSLDSLANENPITTFAIIENKPAGFSTNLDIVLV
ncbi:MAG: calcium-binding protein [Cyanobacteria bacterium P01_A01_bin.84]